MKDSVAKGDFKAVAEEANAFILFNSGAYPGTKNKDKKARKSLNTRSSSWKPMKAQCPSRNQTDTTHLWKCETV